MEYGMTQGRPGGLRARPRGALATLLTVLAGLAMALIGPSTSAHAAGSDDYKYKNSAMDQVDSWNFYTRECTSFVAWRLNNDLGIGFTNQYGGVQWGNAGNWKNAALSAGVPVDTSPTVGSVAYFPANTQGAGSTGHVAWVLAVDSGSVLVEDYNWDPNNPGVYHQHTVNTAGLSFLHLDRATFKNRNSSLYLDVTGPSTDNGALVHQWSWTGADNQWWVKNPVGGGYSELRSKYSNKCLGIKDGSTDVGAFAVQYACNGRTDQKWRFSPTGEQVGGWPVYKIVNYDGQCLGVTASRTDVGAQVVEYTCNGHTDQKWY